jgi:phage shock protein A
VLHRFFDRDQEVAEAQARLERAVEEMDVLLRDLRRTLADTLTRRRDAEAEHERRLVEAGSAGSEQARTALVDAASRLARLTASEEVLSAAETELHEEVSSLRQRIAATTAAHAGSEARRGLARAARAADARSHAAREALDGLGAQVAAAEGRIEATAAARAAAPKRSER